jgi:hypothetical protein
MTDPAARRVLTELYADQGWPAEGEELLHRSLGPRAPAAGTPPTPSPRPAATAAGSWASTCWRLQIVLGRLLPVLYALGEPADG